MYAAGIRQAMRIRHRTWPAISLGNPKVYSSMRLTARRWETCGRRDVLAGFERAEYDLAANLECVERRSDERAVAERVLDAIIAGDDAALLMVDELCNTTVHPSAFLRGYQANRMARRSRSMWWADGISNLRFPRSFRLRQRELARHGQQVVQCESIDARQADQDQGIAAIVIRQIVGVWRIF